MTRSVIHVYINNDAGHSSMFIVQSIYQ